MKLLLTAVLLLIIVNGYSQSPPGSECIRLRHFFELKKRTARNYWPGFNSKMLYGPLFFYTANRTLVIEPNKKLQKRVEISKIDNCLNKGYVGIVAGTDTSQFYMEVDYEEHDTSVLHYRNAIASASDVAIARRFVPAIENIEEWMGMILHESFHLYQTSFRRFRNYQNSTQALLSRDTLRGFYTGLEWYKEMVLKEYDMILHACNTKEKEIVVWYIENLLNLREQRYKKIFIEYGIDIRPLEDMLERSEGVARYMEYCLKRTVNEMPVNTQMQLTDSLYHSGSYRKYALIDDKFMNRVNSQYYYAIGFHLSRLLEIHNISFKNMYKHNIPFEKYLKKITR